MNLREDQGRNAMTLGYALAGVRIQALRNDDVWLAYSLLCGPEGDSEMGRLGRQFASMLSALAEQEFSMTATAARLGISRKTLWQKMKRYGVTRPD